VIHQVLRVHMKTICQSIISAQFILYMVTPLHVLGEEQPMEFPTLQHVSQQMVEAHCQNSHIRVIILKNAKGLIGGYVLQPTIRDSPIPYQLHSQCWQSQFSQEIVSSSRWQLYLAGSAC
jgi:hypothetical protein